MKSLEGFRGMLHCFIILYMGEDSVVINEIVQSTKLRVQALEHICVSLFLLLH